jgi:hypothetical protein
MLLSLQSFTPVSILTFLVSFLIFFYPRHFRDSHEDGVAALDALCFDLHSFLFFSLLSSPLLDLVKWTLILDDFSHLLL